MVVKMSVGLPGVGIFGTSPAALLLVPALKVTLVDYQLSDKSGGLLCLDLCRLEVFLWKHSGDEPVERLRRLLKNLELIFIPARLVFS